MAAYVLFGWLLAAGLLGLGLALVGGPAAPVDRASSKMMTAASPIGSRGRRYRARRRAGPGEVAHPMGDDGPDGTAR